MKTQSFFPKGKGKLGGVVFAVRNGMQVVREYQPVVANPRTSAQILQRAKVNLVGQLSQLVPKAMLRSMGEPNNAANRAKFLSICTKAAVATMSGDVATATLAHEDIVFSRGVAHFGATAASPLLQASNVGVTLSVSDGGVANKYGERIVVLVYETATSTVPTGAYMGETLLPASGTVTVRVAIPGNLQTGNVIAVYRLPYEIMDEADRITVGNMVGTLQDISAAITREGSMVVWGNSLFHASANFTQA